MKEGLGNVPILTIIIVFIAFVSGYLAYNVNYTKAFRMKNRIISLYEEYNGNCDGSCKTKILEYANEIGYSYVNLKESDCNDSRFIPYGAKSEDIQTLSSYGYCEYKVRSYKSSADVVDECEDRYYYRILTKIDIRLPIIENVMNLKVLNVTGDTKTFTVKGC